MIKTYRLRCRPSTRLVSAMGAGGAGWGGDKKSMDTKRGLQSFPGGKENAEDSTSEETAVRETFEETGYQLNKHKLRSGWTIERDHDRKFERHCISLWLYNLDDPENEFQKTDYIPRGDDNPLVNLGFKRLIDIEDVKKSWVIKFVESVWNKLLKL